MVDTAEYSLIRYVPDLERGEALNIGILIWNEQRAEIRLDPDALDRVVKEHPFLARDALRGLERSLSERLRLRDGSRPCRHWPDLKHIERTLADGTGSHIVWSEVCSTDLVPNVADPMAATLATLVTDLIKPRRRPGWRPHGRPIDLLNVRLKPLIAASKILTKHQFDQGATKSGVPRTVDFFVNSNANVALDMVNLAVMRASDLESRADHQALKIVDIMATSSVARYLVHCETLPTDNYAHATDRAIKVIETYGGEVFTDLNVVATTIERLAQVGH